MRQYLRMILFIVIIGSLTSGLLVGMDALTEERIANNQEAELMSIVLNAHEVEFTFANIHEVFEDEIDKISVGEYLFYTDDTTQYVSFVFEGAGVWGPIIGVLTLESDFETIVSITIMEQEETPGLGGVVAERRYLENYEGAKFADVRPYIVIKKNAGAALNEVEAITAATRTSYAFQNILNDSYEDFKAAWLGRNG